MKYNFIIWKNHSTDLCRTKTLQAGLITLIYPKCLSLKTVSTCIKLLFKKVSTAWSPVPIYLQILWNEDFAGFLNHWLGLELFLRELAFTRVKYLLARNTWKGKIGRVWFIPHGNLNRLRIDRTWGVTTCGQDCTWSKRGKNVIQIRKTGFGSPWDNMCQSWMVLHHHYSLNITIWLENQHDGQLV